VGGIYERPPDEGRIDEIVDGVLDDDKKGSTVGKLIESLGKGCVDGSTEEKYLMESQ